MQLQQDLQRTISDVCNAFTSITGADASPQRDGGAIAPFVQNYGWQTYDFRQLIEHHMKDGNERRYLDQPGRMNLRTIFHPARADRLQDLLSDLRRVHQVQKKSPFDEASPDVRLQKIRMSCCGSVFERRIIKLYDQSIQPSKKANGSSTEGGFRWEWTNRDEYESHGCPIRVPSQN